jgi:SpoIID/LytB domain protein
MAAVSTIALVVFAYSAVFLAPVGAAGAQPAPAREGLAVKVKDVVRAASSWTIGPSDIALTGFGFGHGHGMGQWGAYGYATVYGWGYRQILSHYYGGTRLGPLPTPEPDVTVDLTELDGHDAIALAVNGGQLLATWAGGRTLSAAAFEVARSGGYQVVSSGPSCAGPWRAMATTSANVTISSAAGPATSPTRGAGAPVPATIPASELRACLPGIGPRVYQGQLVVDPDGQTDNVLPLEDYIDGVVPAEAPPGWAGTGGEAALQALAVAARSVAVALVSATGSICDTTQCQVYKGLPDQYGVTADGAVNSTEGEVLYCAGAGSCGPPGSVAVTEYSASTGGYSAGGAFPAVPDLGDSVSANPVHTWTMNIPLSDIEAVFPLVGAVQQVKVTHRNGLGQLGGRVEELAVVGSQGSVSVTGDQFAADFDLYSDWFAVSGPQPGPTTSSTSSGSTTSTSSSSSTTSSTTSTNGATTSTTGTVLSTSPPGEEGPSDLSNGYWVANSDGDVAAFGEATAYGTAAGTSLQGIVTGMSATPDDKGYWLVGSDGGVLAFGDASWYGSASKLRLAREVVGMTATPNGRGYWLVATDGGVFAYGNARFYGSTGKFHLHQPIIGMASTPDGHGYWLVSSAGGIFTFGDAHFFGSAGDIHLKKRIVGIVPSSDGRGYFLVAKDGGVFAFGDAHFLGSLPGKQIATAIAGVTATNGGHGYYVVGTNGRVYAFGAATPARQLEGAGLSLAGAVAIVGYRSLA